MKYACCTSFSPAGWREYGRRFVETYLKCWTAPLWVFHEGREFDFPTNAAIAYVDLRQDEELNQFLRIYGHDPRHHGVRAEPSGKLWIEYRTQHVKFARKVFAYTTPKRPECDWWIWIDADTEWTAPVTDKLLADLCPETASVSYLGRKDWDHSECGFLAFNISCGGDNFLKRMRGAYISGEAASLSQTHDSYVFDHIREWWPKAWWPLHNISADLPGMHVWPATLLGGISTHHKGIEAKQKAYAA